VPKVPPSEAQDAHSIAWSYSVRSASVIPLPANVLVPDLPGDIDGVVAADGSERGERPPSHL
jgi:hypothetical protein